MRTDKVQRVDVSQQALEWLKAKYRSVDAMDAELYGTFLAPDCSLMFANNPLARGKKELIDGVKAFWSAIGGLDHSFVNVLGSDYCLAAEALIDYTRKDGKKVTIPCVTVIERNADGLATSLRIFIDTTPIFAG